MSEEYMLSRSGGRPVFDQMISAKGNGDRDVERKNLD